MREIPASAVALPIGHRLCRIVKSDRLARRHLFDDGMERAEQRDIVGSAAAFYPILKEPVGAGGIGGDQGG